MLIGVLGGTGPAGRGLAARLASCGHGVVIGSRDPTKADGVVAELHARWGDRVAGLSGAGNRDAAGADLVFVGTVWDAAAPTAAAQADALAGKPVVSIANGLLKQGRSFRPVTLPEGSVAAAVQAAVPGARVVGAFHHIPAATLAAIDEPVDSDVMVVSDDDDARDVVLDLVDGVPGAHAVDAGPLANALGLEAFSAALLTANLRHRGEGRVRIVGLGPRRVVAEQAR